MKNKFIALALITLSVATTTVSCTKDENPISAQNVATADLKVSVKTDEAQNMATMSVSDNQEGNVKRGDLHAWIKAINMKVTSLDMNYEASKTFNLVDGPTSGGPLGGGGIELGFNINKVAVGKNRVDVTTTTSVSPIFQLDPSNSPLPNLSQLYTERSPYATYTASIAEAIVVQGGINSIENMELRTQHGRAIGLFQVSEHLKGLGVYALVTPVVDGVQKPAMTISITQNGSAIWSDANSTAGKKIHFVIQLMKPNNTPFAPQQFATTDITIAASKSINKIYTIKADGLTEQSASQTFTAQPWTTDVSEEEINVTPQN